jgi:quercetin dioxygenase-like cupin family protein
MTVPFQVTAEAGQALWHMGALLQFKATGKETDGQFWLAEQTSHRGYASPVHRHSREDETFIVLDGDLRIQVGEEEFAAPVGSVTYAPRGLQHTFQVTSATSRFLILTSPAGFEDWFFETGGPAETLTVPEAMTQPPDIGAMISSLRRFGVELLGPPPGMFG